METGSDCLVCFMRQTLATARIAADDEEIHRLVVREIGSLLAGLDPALSPPENAVQVYGRIAELTGNPDPFAALKQQSTSLALLLRDKVRARIDDSADPLYASLRFAIAANVIDYGTHLAFDAEQVLDACLDHPLVIDDYQSFASLLGSRAEPAVLYLVDNCGEIIFDALVIEQLQELDCRVTAAVRGGVILNDATLADARMSGMDCRLVESGISCPGTPIASCSSELQEAFAGADLIISKGQGNFETLYGQKAPLFFLLTVKCPVVAMHIAAQRDLGDTLRGMGEMVLMDGRSTL